MSRQSKHASRVKVEPTPINDQDRRVHRALSGLSAGQLKERLASKWMRLGQILHLFLLITVPGIYAALKVILPVGDPYRVRLDVTMAVATAVWSALLFVEVLRGAPAGSLKEKLVEAYRRLMNKPSPLLLANVALSFVGCFGIWLLVFCRTVEFYSVSEVEVYESEPGNKTQRLGALKGGAAASSIRLPLGVHYLVFYAYEQRDQTVSKQARYAKRIDVPYFWQAMSRVEIPEIVPYEKVE